LPARPGPAKIEGVLPKRLACALLAACAAAVLHAAQPEQDAASVEARAISYLAREVPAWRRGHPCYSCHNNGDAARALMAALSRSGGIREALDDTLAWIGEPARWQSNGGGEGGADDKRLARIQFAHAATAAVAAGLVPSRAVSAAAAIVASDQQTDGSWRLDSSDSIGSPATYGTSLATAVARRTLIAAKDPAFSERIDRAAAWLARSRPDNVPDAVAVVLAFASDDGRRPESWPIALGVLRKGQGRDGGWGPYITSPAEPFDTALAVLGLRAVSRRASLAEPAFDATALAEAIDKGTGYLRKAQLLDGSWPETTRPAGQSSYAQRISTTGWALLALLDSR
jgi:hypothetical protein